MLLSNTNNNRLKVLRSEINSSAMKMRIIVNKPPLTHQHREAKLSVTKRKPISQATWLQQAAGKPKAVGHIIQISYTSRTLQEKGKPTTSKTFCTGGRRSGAVGSD